MRVALYARVSHEEQVKHGLSIEAQTEALRRWADEQGHVVVGEYVDPGISARKSPSKRPALQQLLSDIPSKKTELIAFTRLDRWTRNVKGYYQVQDVLDRYKVAWAAILEDYETVTSAGRFKVNIMLSVSENEADRTADRIRTVFDHKVIMGEAITNALPIGFKIENKRIAHDENAEAALAAFQHYIATGSKMSVRNMMQSDYGLKMSLTAVDRVLHNRLYIGEYRGNPQYCEPIVPREVFDRVQRDMESRATRKTPSGRVYLFSGLIICKECGRRMSSVHLRENGDYYRCTCGHGMYHDCDNRTHVREQYLEEHLLSLLTDVVAGATVEYHQQQKPLKSQNKAAIQTNWNG